MISSARQTLRSGAESGRASKKMKKHGKLLNKTDMILMQKETEKLAREAFSTIKQY